MILIVHYIQGINKSRLQAIQLDHYRFEQIYLRDKVTKKLNSDLRCVFQGQKRQLKLHLSFLLHGVPQKNSNIFHYFQPVTPLFKSVKPSHSLSQARVMNQLELAENRLFKLLTWKNLSFKSYSIKCLNKEVSESEITMIIQRKIKSRINTLYVNHKLSSKKIVINPCWKARG